MFKVFFDHVQKENELEKYVDEKSLKPEAKTKLPKKQLISEIYMRKKQVLLCFDNLWNIHCK